MSIDFDPYSIRFKDDPYPVYRALRDESPVHWAPGSETWTVSRYDDVRYVLDHPELFGSKSAFIVRPPAGIAGKLRMLKGAARFFAGLRITPRTALRSRMLILEDDDVHERMRNLVNRGFTPRRIRAWEARIHELVAGCLAKVEACDRFDLVNDLAIPLPVMVIAEMLGVEPERYTDFKRWSDAIIAGGTGSGMEAGMDRNMLDCMVEMKRYLGPIVSARRAEPSDDLVSVLATADGDDRLSDHEILMFFLLLLVAGNETTTNLMGNAVDALLQNPDQLECVVRDPTLVAGLVEEVLRFDTPIQFIQRLARRDVELRGVRIPARGRVVVLLGSANRDERRFEDPDRLDVGRDTRGHVGFGFGAHFCLGASLARLEAQTALAALVPRLPALARVTPEREFTDSYLVRGLARLELRRAA